MAKYTIIGLVKEATHSDQIRLTVAYRDNQSGDEQYFVSQINKSYEEVNCIPLLLKYSYEMGGHELAQALEYYLKWTNNPWGTSMKVETVNKAVFDEANWFSGDPDAAIIPLMKSTPKMKITVEGAPEYHQGGFINKHEDSVGGAKGGAPQGLDQLPGLDAQVKHPTVEHYCPSHLWSKVKNMIIHLNDHHEWTREQIADWLDEISDPTGETGPDLRFGSQSAKVEPENPCESVSLDGWKNIGYTDHTEHVHLNFDEIAKMYKETMHLSLNVNTNNEQLMKLLMGETNEQD